MAGPELSATINPTGVLEEDTDFPVDYPDYARSPQVGPGTPYGSIRGSVGTDPATGDRDFSDQFLFVTPSDALATVTVSFTSSAVGVTSIDVYNEAFQRVASVRASDAAEGSTTFTPELDARYAIVVRASGLPSGETLDYEVSLDMQDAADQDVWRDFAGPDFFADTATSARSYTASQFGENVLAGSVGGSDTADFVGVLAPDHSGAQVTLRTAGAPSTFVVLAEDRTSTLFTVDLPANAAGTYALPVASGEQIYVSMAPAQAGTELDYSASFDFLQLGLSEDRVNGESVFDAGQNGLGAPTLDLNEGRALAEGVVAASGDFTDMYRFIAPADGVVDVRMDGAELFIYRGGDFVGGGDSVAGTRISGSDIQVLAGEEYFLFVGTLDEQRGIASYRLTAEFFDEPSVYRASSGTTDRVGNFSVSGVGDASDSPFTSRAFVALDENGDRTITGSLGATDARGAVDVGDTLRFAAPADGEFVATFASSGMLSGVRLLDSTTRVLDALGAGTSGSLSAELSEGETYFIELEPPGIGVVSYTLFLDAPALTPRDESSGGASLGDAGDTLASALALPLNEAGDAFVTGSTGFSEDPADFYTFVAPDSGRARFELLGTVAELDLRLRDMDGNSLRGSFERDNSDASLTYDVVAGESYALSLQPLQNLDSLAPAEGPSPYELRVLLPATDPDPGEADTVNGVEIGDASRSESTAAVVALDANDSAAITGSIGFSEDGVKDSRDLYSFTATETGSARLILSDLFDRAFVRLEQFPEISPNNFDDQFTELLVDVVAGQTYAVSVSPSGSSETDYSLSIDLVPGNGGFEFVDDPDDGILFDASVLLDDGTLIAAEDVQLFRTYAGALGRTPDDGGFDWWSDQIERGQHTLDSMVAGFLFSEEFLSFFDDADNPGEIENADFVEHMYLNVFGREPDPGGFAFWAGELESGSRSQAEVIVDMTQSNEFIEKTVDAAIDYLI